MQERSLIQAAKRGDGSAFAAIVESHQRAVYGYLRSHLLEPADAEDLCQEVFLRCYAGRARFDDSSLIRPWLIGIARNLLHEHCRRTKRRKEVAWTELCLELESLMPDSDDHHEALRQQLPTCLESLGPSAREAIDLRYGQNLRLSQIGEKLRRSEGAVKLLVFRARQALRHCLDGKVAGDAA